MLVDRQESYYVTVTMSAVCLEGYRCHVAVRVGYLNEALVVATYLSMHSEARTVGIWKRISGKAFTCVSQWTHPSVIVDGMRQADLDFEETTIHEAALIRYRQDKNEPMIGAFADGLAKEFPDIEEAMAWRHIDVRIGVSGAVDAVDIVASVEPGKLP